MTAPAGPRARAASVSLAGLLIVVAVVAALSVVAAPDASATAYRYWTYWHGTSGGWTFSPVGATYVSPPGSVDGWRFGVSTVAGSIRPRVAPSFAEVCMGHAPAGDGRKLVAVVVDYGTTAEAPPGQYPPHGIDTHCSDVLAGASAFTVLSDYASVRTDGGLVCGVDGYPAGECGVPVSSPAPSPSASHHPSAHPSATSAPRSAAIAPTSAPHATTTAHGATTSASHASSATTPTGSTASGAGEPSAPGTTDAPSAVALGSAGRSGPGGGSGAPPPTALAGAALVVVVGAAAALRARRGRPRAGSP